MYVATDCKDSGFWSQEVSMDLKIKCNRQSVILNCLGHHH